MVKINVKKFSKAKTEATTDQDNIIIEEEDKVIESESKDQVIEIDNDFLNELSNENYINKKEEAKQKEENEKNIKENEKNIKENEKNRKLREKENEKLFKQIEKENKLKEKENKKIDNDDNSIFSDQPSAIIGKEKRILLKKVQSYKSLFPEELKGFKIKSNCSIEELKQYIDEMDSIIEVGAVETFLSDSIISSIKLIEGTTVNSKNYNISGLSFMLKNNQQFIILCKQLYLKYNVFSRVPIEYQLIMIVSTSAYICKNKNANKEQLNSFFNEPIVINNSN